MQFLCLANGETTLIHFLKTAADAVFLKTHFFQQEINTELKI